MNVDKSLPKFIPVLNTDAGSALTVADWESIGVEMVAYDLGSLLIKPGMAFLSQLPSFASYVGWRKPWVLNASDVSRSPAGSYVLRSTYDGSTHSFTLDELLTIILALQPDVCIAPRGAFAEARERLSMKVVEDWRDLSLIDPNRPAQDALQGMVYCPEGTLTIADSSMTMAFEVLDPLCACPTCKTMLTRAYLHHLYEHTPGLCQRFLVLHNVYSRL